MDRVLFMGQRDLHFDLNHQTLYIWEICETRHDSCMKGKRTVFFLSFIIWGGVRVMGIWSFMLSLCLRYFLLRYLGRGKSLALVDLDLTWCFFLSKFLFFISDSDLEELDSSSFWFTQAGTVCTYHLFMDIPSAAFLAIN